MKSIKNDCKIVNLIQKLDEYGFFCKNTYGMNMDFLKINDFWPETDRKEKKSLNPFKNCWNPLIFNKKLENIDGGGVHVIIDLENL